MLIMLLVIIQAIFANYSFAEGYNLKFHYGDYVVPTHECTKDVAFYRLVNKPGRVVDNNGDSYTVQYEITTVNIYEGCLRKK